MMRKTWAVMAAAGLASGQLAAHPAPPDPLWQAFAAPPKDARPILRWWWPGNAVTDAELTREIALFDASHFGGGEIQSFNPGIPNLTPAERAVINNYATPSFFGHVKAAAAAALSHGLKLDYTFGSAWPSGGGDAITPEKALLELTMAMTPVEGGGPPHQISVKIPSRTPRLGAFNGFDPRSKTPQAMAWKQQFDARARIVAVMAMQGTPPQLGAGPGKGLIMSPWSEVIRPGRIDPTTSVDLTDRLRPDGTLDWVPPPGHWQVFVFKQYASNSGVLGSAGQGPQLVLDHFDKTAFAAHASRVGDPLVAALGPSMAGIRATFVDSLELFQDLPWTADFLAEFRKRRGYDLTPWLPFILQPGWMQAWNDHYSPPYFDASGPSGDDVSLAERVRADYRQTVSDLLLDNFVEPFVAWNHAHGLKAKFQAHGGPLDILRGYGMADIPETEDLVDGGNPLFMRLARSAADIYGRTLVSAESLVWNDRAYSVTPEEWRQRIDLLASGGVSAQTMHGYSYALHTETWPGWFAFQPSAFSGGFSSFLDERNPVWPAVTRLAEYASRLNAVLRQGSPVVPVAMYYGGIGYYTGIEDKGAGKQAREHALLAGGYDYDRINPDGLAKSRIIGGQLVTPGGHHYAVLVMPAVDDLRAETAELIARFAGQGLPVIFTDHTPWRETGYLDHGMRDERVRTAISQTLAAGGRIVPEADLVQAVGGAHAPANLRFDHPNRDLIFVEREIGARRIYFVRNAGEASADAGFVAPERGDSELWDAMAGIRTPAVAQQVAGGTHVTLTLAAGASAMVLIDPSRPQRSAPVLVEKADQLLPQTGWSLTVSGHRSGGEAFATQMGSVGLGDWRLVPGLADFSGTGTYRHSFVVPASWRRQGAKVTLDLSGVHDMAAIEINGYALPVLASAPWSADVTRVLRSGVNQLAITIANVPENAMINPKAPGFKDLKPVPAGLEGPVKLQYRIPLAGRKGILR